MSNSNEAEHCNQPTFCIIFQKFNTVPPSNLLTTVSRIVSNTETSSTYKPEEPKPPKRKPKALHVTMWIHVFSLIVTIVLGWIDLIPESGPVSMIYRSQRNDNRWRGDIISLSLRHLLSLL